MSDPSNGDYSSRRDEHLALMDGWAEGRYSSQNLYHPDAALVAAIDAATVQKHAAAAMAYGFLAALNNDRTATDG